MKEGAASSHDRILIATILGTRPEAIKLAPLIERLQRDERFASVVISTAQHRELLDQVLTAFDIKPAFDLDLMKERQTPAEFVSYAMARISTVLAEVDPDLVVVQGDTTSTMVGALAAFYQRLPVAHVEAGLRSYDLANPFPEEGNRRIVTQVSRLDFAPTERNRDNLLREGVAPDSIVVTGNSGIDALLAVAETISARRHDRLLPAGRSAERRLVLVTIHRRESFGGVLRDICSAIRTMVDETPDVEVVFPVHPNPNVREPVFDLLGDRERICLVEPLDYLDFVAAMKEAYLILTDSGGVQEEAPSLNVPVLVIRDVTERPEVVEIGAARLVGRTPDRILSHVRELLTDERAYEAMRGHPNPYGDGHASERMVEAIWSLLGSSAVGC